MLFRILFVIGFGLLTVGGPANPSDLDEFIRLDVNQDGKLTRMEFSKMASDRGNRGRGNQDRIDNEFTKADLNHDGYLSLSEFSTLHVERGSRERP